MQLVLCTPMGEVLTCEILKVSFETIRGYHTLLPKHVDFAAALKTGIISYVTAENKEKYAACHQGLVVKKGANVTISVQSAFPADTLEELKIKVASAFKQVDEERKELNAAMARLELGLLRGFNLLGDANNG